MKRIINIAGIVVVAGVLITLFIFVRLYNKPHTDVHSSRPIHQVTGKSIVDEFKNNEDKANDTYLDKVVEVEGTVKNIDTANGNGIITLGPDGYMESIICNMEPTENRKMLSLKKGQKIKIKGICTGFLMDVILIRGIIVK
ncbi:hypothetical protein OOZ15_01920 [Galbibacter sp. EGI 63066]|uniref:OB-fold protein n=1 Tax=Galbibacter sp. EGI 63066 TaxID=2993559 RepID=UPI0022492E9E|nr:hypothetical protein [Galbibacter sp. EGI 63066]MCX2678687.1 hypothetical protein [Galbibacter sp. EGI 63066]